MAGKPRKRRPATNLPPGVRMKLLADGQPLYEAKVKYPDSNGRMTVPKYAYGHTLEELAIAKADLLRRRKTARRQRPSEKSEAEQLRTMTIAQLAERWMAKHVVKKATSTDDYYRIALTYRVAPYLYGRRVLDLTRRDVEDWQADLLTERKRNARGEVMRDADGNDLLAHSPRTINAGLAALKAMYGKAMDWWPEHVTTNPCKGVAFLDEDERAIRIYDPGEVQRIAHACYTLRSAQVTGKRGSMKPERAYMLASRDATMILTLAYTGIRIAELAGLQLKHYDDGRERNADGEVIRDRGVGSLLVHQQLLRDGTMSRTKGKRYRRVPVLGPLRDALDRYIEQLPPGALENENRHLFCSMKSPDPAKWTPIATDAWRDRSFRPAARAAGFPDAIPHEMRHTFASLIIEFSEGRVSILRLAGWFGHRDTKLIEERYGHIYVRVDAELLRPVNEALLITPHDDAEAAGGGAAPPPPATPEDDA